MVSDKKRIFFSVGFDLIGTDQNIPFDLYINSSASQRERFVRIFPSGDFIEGSDLSQFQHKYHQIYIEEAQRGVYLKSLAGNSEFPLEKRTEVIKDSAIGYLDKLFDDKKVFTNELLVDVIEGCRDSVESMVEAIQDLSLNEIQQLIGSLSFHDFYTYDHSINVSMYCIAIYKQLHSKASKVELSNVGLAGLLHDLGKLKIPTSIINNPGKLTDEQFDLIKKHPGYSKELIESSNITEVDLETIVRVAHEHHENWDGTGYPQKLKGEEIHYLARVCAVADFFDALTTKRSYHEVVSTDEAIEIMSHSSGKKLDPEIFKVFADQSSKLVKGRFATRAVADNFDPSQPTNVLPFVSVAPKVLDSDFFKKENGKPDYGTIKANKDIFGKKKKDVA